MDTGDLQKYIDATKAQIDAYMATSLAFAQDGTLQSYTLDTGQSRQTVTRADLASIDKTIDRLLVRCATLEARLNGSQTIGRPAW